MTAVFYQPASHIDAEWDDVAQILRAAIDERVLCHLGLYSGGCEDMTFDVLGDEGDEGVRDEYVRIGRELSAQIGEIEAELIPVRTGDLIRTVLHASRVTINCDSVVPDQHVIGFAWVEGPSGALSLPEVPRVRRADQLVSGLADKLRERVSLRSQNPGGWLTERPADADDPGAAPTADGSITVHGTATGRYAELCRKAIDLSDLHYIAYCRNGEMIFAFDCFDDRRLGRYFSRMITRAERRQFYADLCRKLPERVGQLGRTASRALNGRLQRVVLDVQQGAIYYYRIGAGHYLVGVTFDQEEVAHADDRLARLAEELRTP
ncbi:hypothetical protein [Lentzea flava]|uniref:Uncharacterized protein n=1 Tax=Lentzea flava TaxID=103732 RepID=A0ABQ2V5V1_9PSEU|nr:hypothetical protein [Lentzea flava]MCP2203324.1 hypothetical protein [Lentzea flava]GGU66973.1 hypothetical protein GCM10010178_68460 [Lentzea flava]